jgi:hypothetical protein
MDGFFEQINDIKDLFTKFEMLIDEYQKVSHQIIYDKITDDRLTKQQQIDNNISKLMMEIVNAIKHINYKAKNETETKIFNNLRNHCIGKFNLIKQKYDIEAKNFNEKFGKKIEFITALVANTLDQTS